MAKVRVPATSANVGCGFDSLGIALNLYTTFDFELLEDGVEFVGFEERFANENNLVYTSLLTTLDRLGKNISGVKISIQNDVPISRGLGSSSTCVVGGIYGAYLLTNTPIDRQEIFTIANEIEGHPDNVSPAIFGNLSASCTTDDNEAVTVTYNVDERFNFLSSHVKPSGSCAHTASHRPNLASTSTSLNPRCPHACAAPCGGHWTTWTVWATSVSPVRIASGQEAW